MRELATDEIAELTNKSGETQSAHARSFEERIERLRDRLLDEAVIPFVGAGISQNAVLQQTDNSLGFEPTVGYLSKKVAEHIVDRHWDNPDRRRLIAAAFSNGDGKFTELSSKSKDKAKKHLAGTWNLSRLAEVASWFEDWVKVIRSASIASFVDLEPLDAHRYIAYLAREGIITEIISTNYDTCIETAFRSTFVEAEEKKYWRGPVDDQSPLAVITDLEEYRRHAGRRFTRSSRRHPVLHLYKINGCAQRYKKHCKKEKEALRIILSERQLQSFHREQWKRDLVCDRARQRSLLFSGFGSDEPQVRHTVLELLEEFQWANRDDENGEKDPRAIAALANAPTVTAFEPWLSFSQSQLLSGFYVAHCKLGDQCKTEAFSRQSSFTGDDTQFFREPSGGLSNKLRADLFWQRLFQCIYGRLLERYARDENGPFFRWLKDYLRDSRKVKGLTERFLVWLYPRDPEADGFNRLFGQFPDLLEGQGASPALDSRQNLQTGRCLLLMEWLFGMRGLHRFWTLNGIQRHLYTPLREDALYVLATLLVLYLCLEQRPTVNPCDAAKLVPEVGLRVDVSEQDSSTSPLRLYLVAESTRLVPAKNFRDGDDRSRVLYQVVIPRIRGQAASDRVRAEMPRAADARKKYWTGRIRRIPASELLGLPAKGFATELHRRFASWRGPTGRTRLLPRSRRV